MTKACLLDFMWYEKELVHCSGSTLRLRGDEFFFTRSRLATRSRKHSIAKVLLDGCVRAILSIDLYNIDREEPGVVVIQNQLVTLEAFVQCVCAHLVMRFVQCQSLPHCTWCAEIFMETMLTCKDYHVIESHAIHCIGDRLYSIAKINWQRRLLQNRIALTRETFQRVIDRHDLDMQNNCDEWIQSYNLSAHSLKATIEGIISDPLNILNLSVGKIDLRTVCECYM